MNLLEDKRYIRPVAICAFKHNDKILVCQAYDEVKNEAYYRPLGGGIEFQETGTDALNREIEEETGFKINNVKYLATFENIFVLEGEPRHEIILLYDARFSDPSVYQKEYSEINEAGWKNAAWIALEEFSPAPSARNLILYPEGLYKLLQQS